LSADETTAARRDDIHGVVVAILGREPETSWEDVAELLPEDATLAELAQYLGSDKDDQEAEVLFAIHRRLELDVDANDVLPPRVRMMTMHGAKGLSAQMVFIPGLEEELLPGPARRPYPGQVLEGARMLYVSITRARLGCVLSYSTSRFMNGQVDSHTPSRYASHLGKPFQDRNGGMPVETANQAVEAATLL
jgi:DNA helicase-2/ATP-dependent DNA helicase PcrA